MEAHNKPMYKEIIEGTYKQYKIPVYQRTYTWEKKQCKQLYDDIITSIKANRKHYLGSIVYSEQESDDNGEAFTFCHIIDGQQRLTSVILLLKAIYDSIEDQKNRIKIRIYNSLYNDNCEEQYKLKLQSIDNDNDELRKILLGNFNNLNELSNVTKNYYYFLDRIKKSKEDKENKIDCETLFKGICNLEVVEIKLDENDNPQLIFESINSTGKGLNNAEKIRNYLLMGIRNPKTQKKYYEKYWVTLCEDIGSKNVEAFFYDYLVMKDISYIRSEDLYDNFKKFYTFQDNIDAVFEDIIKFAEYYKLIVCNDSKNYSKDTNSLCEIFSTIRHNTIYSFLMRICDDYSCITKLYNNNVQLSKKEREIYLVKEKEFNDIIEFLGNYAIRRNICEIPSSSLRRFYGSLYNNIFKNKINKEKYPTSIKTYLCSIITSDQFPTDDNFKEHLMTVNLYKRANLLNIFFQVIENKGKEKLDWSNLTIEHILPQNPDKGWKDDLGKDFQYVYEKYLNTLGNLSITGYNSEYKNKQYAIKQRELLKKKKDKTLKVFILNKELLNTKNNKWDEKLILKRAKRLSNLIIEKYSYPIDIDNNMEFNSYNEIYFDEEENKFVIESDYKLMGFKLLNKKYKATSYIEIYKSLLEELYKVNPNILKQMAENKWKFEKASRVYISNVKSDITGNCRKLNKESEIYIETNFNRYSILELIKSVIDIYENEIDLNDFCLLFENNVEAEL